MKKIIAYFKEYFREERDPWVYIISSLLIAVFFIFNYSIDFEDSYIDNGNYNKPIRVLYYFLFHLFIYCTVLVVILWRKKELSRLANVTLWLFLVVGFFFQSLKIAFPYLQELIQDSPATAQFYFRKVLSNLQSFFVLALPLYAFYRFIDKKTINFYGVTTEKVILKPYLILLLAMVPLIIFASFQPGFLKQYPMYKPGLVMQAYNLPEWVFISIYELAYGLDFFNVELFYRGFLIIGLSRFLGNNTLIPMATVYCALHFGKPAGEAFSSIFGGFILGLISLKTKNIWGGTMIHIGIAWLMEIAAAIQKL